MSLFGSSGNQVKIAKKKFAGEPSIKSFVTKIKGKIVRGLVVKKGDRYFAFENLCKHLPVTLDLEDDNFFTHDRLYLQCHMHGAMYEMETGFCIAGPCQGARLNEFKITDLGSEIVVNIPPGAGEVP